MEKRRILQKGLGVASVLIITVSVLFAADEPQQPQRGQRPNAGQRDQRGERMQRGGRGGFDRAAMRERMLDMMQERMGASDEEWTVIKPRLSKVMELGQDASGRGGMMGMFGRRRGGRGPERPDAEAESSAVQKASADLQATLEKEAPSAAEIKAKLTALRGAREKAKQNLIKAQQELREVLTLKQEAQLVMMGMLD